MFKIEKALLISQETSNNLTFINVIKEFFKETNMLVSNIHLTHIHLEKEVGNSFPVETNKYDGSWYKNLLIAAEIIIDRLYSRIDENKDYLRMFDDVTTCDFVEFSKKWNKINFMVKYNLPEYEWEKVSKELNISATSRKLEELIAKGVVINLPLLKSLALELNKYKSVAKELDQKGSTDYESLLDVLAPQAAQQTGAPVQGANGMQPQQAPLPNTSPVGVIREKRPLSPVKKEMDQILKWIAAREEEFKEFKARQNKGFSPEEYKALQTKLTEVQAELKDTTDELNTAKKSMPVDPFAKELGKLGRWAAEQEAEIKRYNKLKNGVVDKQELAQLQKFYAQIQSELVYIEEELRTAKGHIPVDPLARELSKMYNWCKAQEEGIRAYKRKLIGQSINDELKLLDKELQKVDDHETELNATIKFINSNKPVDPYKAELDELARWVSKKEREIKAAKTAVANKEKELLKAKKAEELAVMKEAQKRVQAELADVDSDIDTNRKIINPNAKPLPEPKVKGNSLAVVKQGEASEKLYNIADVYKIEAEILEAALSLLPGEMAKNGKKSLPKMLQHLLEEGYIEVNENYVLDGEHECKLREVKKVPVH